jgi:DNA-binding IclR family transcriptional regulator
LGTNTKQEKKIPGLSSIEKAFVLLDCFLGNNEPRSLKELAQETGWAKSTVHDLLAAMRGQGVIVQEEESGKYRMGIHLFQLGHAMASGFDDIIDIAKPHMGYIAESTNKSIHLTAFHYPNVVLISRAEPTRNPLQLIVSIGTSMPLYCNAPGKLFLSNMTDNAIWDYLKRATLVAHTSKTITDPDELFAQIRQIREQGYATEMGERNIGIQGVAAPIYNWHGDLSYSISAVGIFNDIHHDEFQGVVPVLVKTAKIISGKFGYSK